MKIYKFGGTSVGSASRMASVAEIINDGQEKIVVLSAMSGTTNSLVEISDNCYAGDVAAAAQKTESLREKYRSVVDELFSSAQTRERAHAFIEEKFDRLGECINANFTVQDEKKILSFGELISTELFHYYLSQQGIGSALIPALSFMRTDRLGEPDLYYITKNIEEQLSRHEGTKIFITQGYICLNAWGEVDNLQRGGSDYTATIIGAALKADEV